MENNIFEVLKLESVVDACRNYNGISFSAGEHLGRHHD